MNNDALVTYVPPSQAPHVPAGVVRAAVADAASVSPSRVHPTVALSVSRSSTKTASLRLERLARVVMAADERITDPWMVWGLNWTSVTPTGLAVLDRSIRENWDAPATRNAMRDSVRAVLRESLKAGLFTHDQVTPLLNVVRPEKTPRDRDKHSRGHLDQRVVHDIFYRISQDHSITARRDGVVIALMVGAGLRRSEVCGIQVADLDARTERITVHGKGSVVRDVPLAPGVRRALVSWLEHRGEVPGFLVTSLSKTMPRTCNVTSAMSVNTVAQIVRKRCGEGVSAHDLRRTFTGDLLDSGADLSIVSQVLGHSNPATTALYDRRGFTARRMAVERLFVPFEDERAH